MANGSVSFKMRMISPGNLSVLVLGACITISLTLELSSNTVTVDFVEVGSGFEVRQTGAALGVPVLASAVANAALGDDARPGRPDRGYLQFRCDRGG
ncbi:MAG TPA: hypothetical protein VGA95_03225 [Thermodesulfobacteriota bacterium]